MILAAPAATQGGCCRRRDGSLGCRRQPVPGIARPSAATIGISARFRCWLTEFWGKDFNPAVIDELAAPDIRFEHSLHAPCRGREGVRSFAEKFRAAFPDLNFWGTADLIAEGDYVVGQWEGGGTHTGEAFDDIPVGSLPPATGKTMRFTGTTILKVERGLITEEVGLDDGVAVLRQLGLITAA